MNMAVMSIFYFVGLLFFSVGVGMNVAVSDGLIAFGVGTCIYAFVAFLFSYQQR